MADNTEQQPDSSQSASARLSMPKDVEQHPQAPKIAGYVLVKTIGKGAFAEVWKAWQTRTHKWVAVKVFIQKTGVNWLFLQREVERLIRLDKHPHIVSLLDADLEGELPYYVMDYMEGGSLEQFVDPKRAVAPARAALWMEEMAQALAYVHSKGMIHCDLKPANVLLDEEGHVRLADFGQSRIVTDSSSALGTLFYMAPEQAVTVRDGEPLQPDVRWDVFGLGATMWAIVTGRVPRGDEDARDALEAAPSLDARLAVYRGIVTARGLPDCRVANPEIDEDLSAIIDRCSDATSLRRYDGVPDVLSDLGARRENRPVKPLAHRTGYRARKFMRRNSALVALSAFAFAALAGAFAQIVKERDSVRRELSVAYLSRAQRAARDSDWAAAALFNAQANKIYPSDVARWNTAAGLADLAVPAEIIATPDTKAGAVFLAPDFKTLLMAGTTEATLLDFKTRLPIGARIVPGDTLLSAAFSADGGFIATASDHGELRLWDARTGLPVGRRIKKADAKIESELTIGRMRIIGAVDQRTLGVGPGGSAILSSVYNDGALQWDPRTGAKLASGPSEQSVEEVAYSLDGRAAASIGYSYAVVWNTANGAKLGSLKLDAPGLAVAFSPDGSRLATGGEDGFTLWDLKTNARVGHWDAGKAVVTSLAFGPKGAVLAVGATDGRAVIWDLIEGRPTGRWMMHPGPVTSCAFSPDGSSLATTTNGRTLRIWDISKAWSRRREFTLPGYYPSAEIATYTPDGRYIVTVARTSRDVERYDALTLRAAGKPQQLPKTEMISKVFFNPDRTVGLLADYKNGSHLWDFRTGKAIGARAVHDGDVTFAAFSPDGQVVVTAPWQGHARLWDVRTGAPLGRPLSHDGPVKGAAFSPDSRWVVTGSTDATARIWDARTGEAIGRPMPSPRDVYSIAVSPDGDTIASSSWNDVQLWSAKTQAPLGAAFAHPSTVMNMVFNRDGSKLLVATADYKARLWDVPGHRPIGKAMSHDSYLYALKFSPDGKLVLTSSWDKTSRVWDAVTGEPVGEAMRFPVGVTYAEFSPDGRTVIDGGADSGTVNVWDVSWLGETASPDELVRRAQSVTLRRINERGDIEISAPVP
jgi:WD40 repeat protein/serine/threonine protein kinase